MAEHTLSDADNSKLSQNQHARSQLPRMRHIAATKSRSYFLSSLSIADEYLSLSLPLPLLFIFLPLVTCAFDATIALENSSELDKLCIEEKKSLLRKKRRRLISFLPSPPSPPLHSFAYRDLALSFVMFSRIVSSPSLSLLSSLASTSLLRNPRRESESEHDC